MIRGCRRRALADPDWRLLVRALAVRARGVQVVLALASTELVYFELDSTQMLNEFQERKELGTEISCLAIGPIPEGRQRSRFLVRQATRFIGRGEEEGPET